MNKTTIWSLTRLWFAIILIFTACGNYDNDQSLSCSSNEVSRSSSVDTPSSSSNSDGTNATCKGISYNTETHGCCESAIGNPIFNLETQLCFSFGIHDKCGDGWIGAIEFCCNNTVYQNNGRVRCTNDVLERRCGDSFIEDNWYNTETQTCDNGIISDINSSSSEDISGD